jgi:hypothetical protein
MSKREAEKLVREIWAAKDDQEALTGNPISLADFTALFLEKRYFSIPRLVTEVRLRAAAETPRWELLVD